MRVSFCVHSYNEAAAVARLVRSSYPLADLVSEWVIVDHRSDDGTAEVVAGLEGELSRLGVRLVFHREDRDFSAEFPFARLREETVKRCGSPVVVLHDADFILGPAYRDTLVRGIKAVAGGRYYGAGYNIPVVWDHLVTDDNGVITDHGRVWLHGRPPRILHRKSITYRQTGNGGMWEQAGSKDSARKRRKHLTGKRPAIVEGLLSVNVKPPERRALRHTMGTFHRDLLAGSVTGTWLENYARGGLEERNPYEFGSVDLRGWRTNTPNLRVFA